MFCSGTDTGSVYRIKGSSTDTGSVYRIKGSSTVQVQSTGLRAAVQYRFSLGTLQDCSIDGTCYLVKFQVSTWVKL
jgi:hypothetical protein